MIPHNLDSIPAELRALPQWVCWRLVTTAAYDRVPINPATGKRAVLKFPSTWGTFDAAVAACSRRNCNGIGFVFTADDDFFCVQLRASWLTDNRELYEWDAEVVAKLQSYTEVSPFGLGATIIARGKLFVRRISESLAKYESFRKCMPKIIIYDRTQFLCVTGQRLPNTSARCESRQVELNRLVASLETLIGKTFSRLPEHVRQAANFCRHHNIRWNDPSRL
jgi:primase-polymerase (primpol)-like protein